MKTLFLICLFSTVAVCFPVGNKPDSNDLVAPGQSINDNGAIKPKDSSLSSESKESGNQPDQENTDNQISRVRRSATNVAGSPDCDGSNEGSGSGSSEQVSIESSGNDYVEGSGDYDSSSGDQ